MADLVQVLTIPFVAGFIVQRFLEILDAFTTARFVKDASTKKMIMAFASLVIGCALAGFLDTRMFHQLRKIFPDLKDLKPTLDILFSGIFISAGTEGFNSLMKFASYKKEASKADAAGKRSQVTDAQLRAVNP
jgi:hypothetical protein